MIGDGRTSFLNNLIERIPRERLILIIIIIVVVIVAVVVALVVGKSPEPEVIEEPELVYEIDVGDVKFKLKEFRDRGSVLELSESKMPDALREDLVTTGRFIEVTLGVGNVGTDNIKGGDWQIKELFDEDGKTFYSSKASDYWTPEDNQCGTLLKPGFPLTPCTRIYDVAPNSTGLKVEVWSRKGGADYIDLGI